MLQIERQQTSWFVGFLIAEKLLVEFLELHEAVVIDPISEVDNQVRTAKKSVAASLHSLRLQAESVLEERKQNLKKSLQQKLSLE